MLLIQIDDLKDELAEKNELLLSQKKLFKTEDTYLRGKFLIPIDDFYNEISINRTNNCQRYKNSRTGTKREKT